MTTDTSPPERETAAAPFDTITVDLRNEPCAFKRACFREGWDVGLRAAADAAQALIVELMEGIPAKEMTDIEVATEIKDRILSLIEKDPSA